MNRIDRVTAILIQLQSRNVVKAQDIAERFDISLRTVYRDIRTLEEAGVPLIGEAGIGYSIVTGYRLPPVMFTTEEATAFLTAQKFMEKFTDPSTNQHHNSAMYKIRAVLRDHEKELLENIENHIEIHPHQLPFNDDAVHNVMQPIFRSISERKTLSITYTSIHSREMRMRRVEPLGIFYGSDYWHLIAYCQLRLDYRDFRIDRINKISITEDPFTGRHPKLKEYLAARHFEPEKKRARIRFHYKLARHMERQKYSYGFISEEHDGDDVIMTFECSYLHGLARWYMMYADGAEIVEGEELKVMVRELLEKINSKVSQET